MPRYLTDHPGHVNFLDLMQTQSVGFRAEFFKFKVEEVDTYVASAVSKVQFAVQDAIGRISRLAADAGKTTPAKHDAARQVYDNLSKEVAKEIQHIRRWSEREAEAAQGRALAVLAPESGKDGVYQEIRAYAREQAASGSPEWPATLSKLNRENIDVARALRAGPGFLSGVSDERRQSLSIDAMMEHAPDDAAAMQHAVDVGKGAEKMERGMSRLRAAAYVPALSDRARSTFVDPDAPFAAPPAEGAE